jgi:septal ring-binding cell division protein DamX
MTDKTDTARPSRGGSGAILGRLAVGALLSTPLAAAAVTAAAEPAAAEPAAAEPAAAAAPEAVVDCTGTGTFPASVHSIRAQFESSYTAGAVAAPSTTDMNIIICDQ